MHKGGIALCLCACRENEIQKSEDTKSTISRLRTYALSSKQVGSVSPISVNMKYFVP